MGFRGPEKISLDSNPSLGSDRSAIVMRPRIWSPLASPTSLEPPRVAGVKALVWFWWIDETLRTNLVYQSDYEIGSTTPSGEANEESWHDDGVAMVMIKCLDLEKK